MRNALLFVAGFLLIPVLAGLMIFGMYWITPALPLVAATLAASVWVGISVVKEFGE